VNRGALFRALGVETFRFHGALLALGNRLCAGTGLTSARWQVLAAIALGGPLTVAQIARPLGLTRQSVQRLVDELETAGIVRRTAHPESRRARPVALTPAGAAAYAEVERRERPWVTRAAAGVPRSSLATTLRVLRALRERVEREVRHGGRRGPAMTPGEESWH
jgi:DNA-binding MarR family transcriptional regulator